MPDPMPDPREDPKLTRLAQAIDAYMGHQADVERGAQPDAEELLARESELRDLLEPMLSAAEEAGEALADSKSQLGEYRLVRELGRGGMGVVYEAIDLGLQRRVALKVLVGHLTVSARQVERFRREAHAAARLEHPGIVRIHAVGEARGMHYIAMELRAGRDLRDVLQDCRAGAGAPPGQDRQLLPELPGSYFEQVAGLVARVADALAYSHDHGVIHRDIKPQNILVEADGQACIVDFGLAKNLETPALSRSGDFAGTPDYISPEQARGDLVDGRSDVFSLGVVLYEMLTLARPFAGASTTALIRAVSQDEPRSARACNPEVPRDLDTICAKALEKEPARRYTARELAAELRRFLRHEPILARPVGLAGQALRFARRQPAQALALGLAFCLFVVTPIVASLYYRVARDEIAAEQERTAAQRDAARSSMRRVEDVLNNGMRLVWQHQLYHDPSSHAFWQRFFADSARFYQEHAALAAQHPGQEATVAHALDSLAWIRLRQGEFEAAERAATEAVAAFRVQLTREVATGRLRRGLAASLVNRALAAAQLGRAVSSRELGEGVRLYRGLLAGAPEGSDDRLGLHMDLAEALGCVARYGDTADRSAAYQAAVGEWRALAAAFGGRTEYLGRAPALRIDHGLFLLRCADVPGAEREFEEVLVEVRELRKVRPRFALLRFVEAEAQRGRMHVMHRRGEAERATAAFEAARETMTGLCADFPTSRRYTDQLTLLQAERVQILMLRGPAAGHEIQAILGRAMPNPPEVEGAAAAGNHAARSVAMLASSRAVLETWRRQADPDRIHACFGAAIADWRRVTASRPDDVVCARDLAATLSNYASWLSRADPGAAEQALELANEAVQLQRGVLQRVPDDRLARRYLGIHLRLVRDLCRRLGRDDGVRSAAAALQALAGKEGGR